MHGKRTYFNLTTALAFALAVLGSCRSLVDAQPVATESAQVVIDGKPVQVQVGPGGRLIPQPGGAQPAKSEGGAGEQAKQEGSDENKKAEEGKEESKEGESKEEGPKETIARPTTPPKVSDPRELEAHPDADGMIQFGFNGQTWPDVLQWLANVSDRSLDWQELPNDYINLTTQRKYSLDEARDLINSLLLARGFTLIEYGEVMKVVKVEKLDPSLIPRVTEEDLYDRQPHDFVKITFLLPENMEVAKAAEDVKQALSTHAKVIPLPATKRLLVIDTVANLRMVSMILNEERLVADGKIIPVEIILKHRRAEKTIDILYVLLGLDPAAQPSQEELAVQQQKMQLLMQMQGAGKDVSAMLQKDGPPVYIAFNSQRNSLIVNAPPAQLKIITRAIEMLDVPSDQHSASTVVGDPGRRIPRSYKLETVDPRNLLQTLEEIGDLDPLAELRADGRADILFARATEADHEKIARMIEELDGAQMETRVYHLRKHPADAVAGTLQSLFAGKKEEDESQSRRSRYYGYYDYYGRNDEDEIPKADLRVDADVENNRLIVRGTTEQLDQVDDFLAKLGESPDGVANTNQLRVVESLDPAATAELIRRLRQMWPSVGDNELLIEGPAPSPDIKAPDASKTKPPDDQEAAIDLSRQGVFQFAVDAEDRPAGGGQNLPPAGKPPVIIRITPDGRLLLSSEDTQALDALERLIESSIPPQERFKIFPIEYVRASSIYLTLDLLYKDEQKDGSTESYFDSWSYDWVPGKSADPAQMSKRKKLHFDYDIASNTILVANASPAQLREIEMLIDRYDQPSSADDAKARRTVAIPIRYSRANVVATALKDVYRDLLSQRDKEFETEEKKGGGVAKESTTIIRYGPGSGSESDGDKRPTPVKVGFQGALSVGVDEISNTIIVSVQEELFDSVYQIVKTLDEAARPQTTVAVHSVATGVSAEAIHKALAEALGETWVGGKPEQRAEQQEGEGRDGEGGRRDNGRGREGREGRDAQPSSSE